MNHHVKGSIQGQASFMARDTCKTTPLYFLSII